jgi:glycosyltransferase involved in cell wall biosynthesis
MVTHCMGFSIVTPSYNQSAWLKLCVASIADQRSVTLEHIVQDSCSKDGTQDWLAKDPRVKAFIEKDSGMYDAVNRGFTHASHDILAYLNCDEQYLPGSLKRVEEFFAAHSELDAVVCDTIVTDSKGDYICHRYSLVPRKYQIWVRFPVLTCSLFIRRRVVADMGIRFNLKWTNIGDWFWIYEMVQRGVRFGVLPDLTSTFTDTGENLNLKESGVRERREKWAMAPAWVRALKYPFIAKYRFELALRGPNFRKPYDYSLYTLESPAERVIKHAAHPTSFWRR